MRGCCERSNRIILYALHFDFARPSRKAADFAYRLCNFSSLSAVTVCMHIGIIMDGNGRWATAKGLPRLSGHQEGVRALKQLIKECPALGVHTVTLFAFAIANWKRDKEEVDGLWKIFSAFVSQDLQELLKNGVKITVIGNRSGLPGEIQAAVADVESKSSANAEFHLQIALNYDGVEEVARLIQKVLKEKKNPEDITPEFVQNNLDTVAGNDPDIILRTGMPKPQEGMGVWRSSAFLPIQSVQSVCVGTDVLWPDFTTAHLKKMIAYADPDSRLFGAQRTVCATSAPPV